MLNKFSIMIAIKITVIAIFSAVALFGNLGISYAQVMTGTTYNIEIDSINIGGGRSTSGSYALESTQGEIGAGRTTATLNYLYAGFLLPVVAVTPSPSAVPSAGPSKAGTAFAFLQPQNIENFFAVAQDSQIYLLWQNPAYGNFSRVRIMRSEEFYPVDPFDGQLVYDGAAQEFLDIGLENGTQYYYTAFAYDIRGKFASGAVVSAIPQAPGIPFVPPVVEPPLVPPELIPEILKDLSLLDFDFIQEGAKLSVIGGRVEVKSDFPFTIAIDYDKLPEVLKTILATMRNEKGEIFSFLLRVDESKKRYLATMNPPASGVYPVSFIVVDFKNQGLQKVQGELRIIEVVAAAAFAVPGVYPERPKGVEGPELVLFLSIALFLLAAGLYLRRKLSKRIENYAA